MISSIYSKLNHLSFFSTFRPPPEPSHHLIIAGDSRTLAGIFILRLAPYRRSNMRERRGSAPRPPRLRNSIALAPPPLGEKSRFLNYGERGLFSHCTPFNASKASTLNPCTHPLHCVAPRGTLFLMFFFARIPKFFLNANS